MGDIPTLAFARIVERNGRERSRHPGADEHRAARIASGIGRRQILGALGGRDAVHVVPEDDLFIGGRQQRRKVGGVE